MDWLETLIMSCSYWKSSCGFKKGPILARKEQTELFWCKQRLNIHLDPMLARKEQASIGKFNNYPYPRPKENKKTNLECKFEPVR